MVKVLVAEDDLITRLILEEMVRGWGYDIVVCENGLDAVGILTSDDPPRVAVLDWNMPRMSGVDVCRAVRERKPFIYLILLTLRSTEDDYLKGLDSGAHCFQSKPISPAVLKRHIEVGCRLVETEDQLNMQGTCALDSFYKKIITTVESRKNLSGGMFKHVAEISFFLANALKLDSLFALNIQKASIYNEIGMISVPEHILMKKDELTEFERNIIKNHTNSGEDLLSMNPEYSTALSIAKYHHESWNGELSHHGLSGTDIPVEARIVSIASVYCAMRSKRYYRDAFSHENAVSYIKSQSGLKFDPLIADVFCDNSEQFKNLLLS